MKVLYISYDGALDPLGRSQVVPYLEGLASRGHQFDLITFEKSQQWSQGGERDAMRKRLQVAGVRWHPLRYHKRLSVFATTWDLARGTVVAAVTVRWRGIDVLHARSYPSAVIADIVGGRFRVPWVFDMRGLYATERVDGGLWPANGRRFRAAKRLERRFLRRAAAIVTLTHASVDVVERMRDEAGGSAPVTVIPTAVDLERFRPATTTSEAFTLAYVGSLGTWYLLDEMLEFAQALRRVRPDVRLLFLVNDDAEAVRAAAGRSGFPLDHLAVAHVAYADMPAALSRVDATIALIRPSPSKIASAATKVSESWALGLPVVLNRGVGDGADLAEEHRIGVVVDLQHPESWEVAARALVALTQEEETANRCRAVAEARFALGAAVGRYAGLYGSIQTGPRRKRIVVVSPHSVNCAPGQRLKYEQYFDSWRAAGYDVDVRPLWTEDLSRILYQRGHFLRKVLGLLDGFRRRVSDLRAARRADLVYLFLEAFPLGPPIFERLVARSGTPIVFDIDDMVLLPHSSAANPFMRFLRSSKKSLELMEMADHVVVCTDHLRQIAQLRNDAVTQISSTIDTRSYIRQPRRRDRVVVGWSGSHSTSPYLHALDDVLRELQATEGTAILVIGDGSFSIPGAEVETRPWRLESEVADLSEIDIGLYPLPDDEWVLGKSGLKALQYMALGIPTVAQRRGMNSTIIDHGANGYLADKPNEWLELIRRLVHDPALRERMGGAGKRTVAQRYSVEVTAPVYLDVLRRAERAKPVR